MKRRRYAKGNVLIDLTSLLDVIFILLLVVFSNWKNNDINASEKSREADQREMEADRKYKLYQEYIDTADSLHQYAETVSVTAGFNTSDIKERYISVLIDGEIKTFDLHKSRTKRELEKFQETLVSYIEDKDNENRPIILSLNENDEEILYRDEQDINDIFSELRERYSNVYIK